MGFLGGANMRGTGTGINMQGPARPGASSVPASSSQYNKMKGGNVTANAMEVSGYNDGASGYVLGKYGDMNAQENTVFGPGSVTAGNGFVVTPDSKLIHGGGRRRRRRGGFLLGQVVNQAIVPFGLLGLQNRYGTRRARMGKSSKSRRMRR